MEFAHRLVSSRGGTAFLAALAALAAGVAVLAYVKHYRASVDRGGAPATVLVANEQVPKGMSAAAALSGHYLGTTTVRVDQLASGAVSDPAAIRDEVATRDISPGERIDTADFAASAGGLSGSLTGSQRAVAVTVDASHGVAGQVQQGDRVDVIVGFNVQSLSTGFGQPVVKTLVENVPVLSVKAPSAGVGSQGNTNVVLRVTPAQAAKIAFSEENGKVWLILRPLVGAKPADPSLVTLQSLLLGTKPILSGAKGGR